MHTYKLRNTVPVDSAEKWFTIKCSLTLFADDSLAGRAGGWFSFSTERNDFDMSANNDGSLGATLLLPSKKG